MTSLLICVTSLLICSNRIFTRLAACVVLLAAFHQGSFAQVLFGSIVGNVTDASGAAITAAMVKITEVSTNESRSVETNDAGIYNVATVTAGTYRIEIAKPGFTSFTASNVVVNQNNVVRVDAQLKVGEQSQRIEMTSVADALETDRADVHAEVGTQALENLPQPTRAYEGLLQLVPGATPPAGQLGGGAAGQSLLGIGGIGGHVDVLNRFDGRHKGGLVRLPWIHRADTLDANIRAADAGSVEGHHGPARRGFRNPFLVSGSDERQTPTSV